MIESFEQIEQAQQSETTSDAPTALLQSIAVGAVALYISLTAFGPHILSAQIAEVPLYFSVLFFILTAVFLIGWGVWLRLVTQTTTISRVQAVWPLGAIPLSLLFFYLIRLF